MNRLIILALLAPFVSVYGTGVLSVAPNFASSDEMVSVTMALDPAATPSLPPSHILPLSMSIGGIAGSSITRVNDDCTASFSIPALQEAGELTCEVVFNGPPGQTGPTYTLVDSFTVVDASAPPSIVEDPDIQNVVSSATASFSVSATGADPLSYQWQFDTVDIVGATSATYSIASVAESDAGEYRCVVTNANGSATSATATLTVLDLSAPLPRPYSIVDTGQRKSYGDTSVIGKPVEGDEFYGQDSNYIGNQPTYVTGADGKTVYDYHTGLTWTQTPDLNGDGTIDVNDKKTQADAVAYVATLNATNFGGYSDWRLPNIKEIYSLMDFRGTDPTSDDQTTLVPFIDTDYFDFAYGDTTASPAERTIDAQFATTSIYVDTVMGGQAAMFGLNLADGRIKGYGLNNIDFYVFYVRGNTDYGVNDFEDNSDLTVTDHATGLMWQQDDSDTGMLWKDALAHAEASTHAGYDDWRLPNAKELQSLLDYTRSPGTTSSPAIDAIFTSTQILNEGGQVDYPWYYTGTTHANQNGEGKAAVYMCFGRATGYFNSAWTDVHGAGAQRSESKAFDTTGYTQEGDGWYFTVSPQGDSARWYNYVRLVRDVPEATAIHVNAATPANAMDQDGASWDTAFADLQDALATVVSGDEIWVAEGVYYPDEGEAGVATVTAGSRTETFQLISGVEIYGGFNGTESTRDARDANSVLTILSGDIGVQNTATDNSYHVLTGSGTDNTSLLDGFVITAGQADGSGNKGNGAALLIFNGASVVRRCLFEENFATQGAGVYVQNNSVSESVRFIQCQFLSNTSDSFGIAVSAYLASLELTSCEVRGNEQSTDDTGFSAAVSVVDGLLHLKNCLVTGNTASQSGGILVADEGGAVSRELTLENTTISGNYATSIYSNSAGGCSADGTVQFNIYNSIIWGNTSVAGSSNVRNLDSQSASLVEGKNPGSDNLDGTDTANDQMFLSPITASATANSGGDFRLNGSSTSIGEGDESSLAIDTADLDEDGDVEEVIPYDIAGNPRINGLLEMGAYEYTGPTVVNPVNSEIELDKSVTDDLLLIDIGILFNSLEYDYSVTVHTANVLNWDISDTNGLFYRFTAIPLGAVGDSTEVTVTATDSSNGSRITVPFTVTIVSSLTVVESFRDDYSLASDGSDDSLDWSGNGITNMLYLAFGLGDPNAVDIDRSRLPAFGLDEETDNLAFEYVRLIANDTGLVFSILTSADLLQWDTLDTMDPDYLPLSETSEPIDDDYERIILIFEQVDEARFYTLEVHEFQEL